MDKKIEQIVMFIDREANERVLELDNNTDEECHASVNQIVTAEKRKINLQYDKLERATLKGNIVSKASVKNSARLELSTLKHSVVQDIFERVTGKVKGQSENKTNYSLVLRQLTLQSLIKLLSPAVLVRVQKNDQSLITNIAEDISRDYTKLTQIPVNIRIDGKTFLPDSEIGGVVVYSVRGEKKAVNTLRYRVELIQERMLPVVRHFLFGVNPIRKFFD